MNVLFAWLLFVGVLMMGAPTAVGEDTATAAAKLTIASVVPNSPAASLPANAVVESLVVGDTTVSPLSPKAVSAAISGGGGLPVTVTYVAGGREQTETLQPVTGLVAAEPERYTLGVQLILVETIVYPFGQAVVEGTLRTYDTTVAIIFGLSDLLYQAVRGEADFSQVAGPVGIVNYVGDAAQVGLSALLVFTAIISLNLAVINLLPIPALDGGRLVFVAIEAVTRRPINPAWAGRLNLVGFALLMLLMLVVTYNDIVKLF